MNNIICKSDICSTCGHLNSEGSFFCYNCGMYFTPAEDLPQALISKDKATELTPPTIQASILIPGRPEIVLNESPVFVERSSFDQTLPKDVLMSISRQHIRITYEKGIYYVQDYGRDGTGSTNHTRLNNIDIHHKGKLPLKDGDKLELSRQVELTLTFKQS